MNLQRTVAIVYRQWCLLRSSPARMLPLFVWVAVDILLWGFMTRYLNTVAGAEMDFVPSLLGAVVLWGFFMRVMMGVTTTFLEDVWSRNFLNVFATPIRIVEYVGGLVLATIGTSAIGLVVMVALAGGVFGLSLLRFGLALIPFLLVLFLFGITLGIVGSAVVLRFGPAAEWFVWPIPALISPFAGVFYPVSTLPVWMQGIAHALPPAYVFEGMRAIVEGGELSRYNLWMGIGLALVYLALAGAFFARIHRHALRSGLIARYSAETVS